MAASTEAARVHGITPEKGKGLISNRCLKKGDVILQEKPIVCAQFSWNEAYKYKACEFCMRSLETAEEMVRRLINNPGFSLPHPQCCDVDKTQFAHCPMCQTLYCSPICRDMAFSQYHRVLCLGSSKEDSNHPLSQLVEQWKSFHYPPESASIMLIAKMIAMVKQAEDKGETLSLFSDFVNSVMNEREQIAHKLLGETFEVQREVLRELLTEAIFEEAVQEWFTPEGFKSLFALIGTNGQGIGSSSFSQWVKNVEKLPLEDEAKKQLDSLIEKLYDDMWEVSGQFLDCEGSGLYRIQSACNHSCCPNAEITFPHGDNTLTLVALEDINAEEEICISYLNCCDLDRSRHSRQKVLRENYLFMCRCEKCITQADDASVTSEEDEVEDMEDEDEMGDLTEETDNR